VLIPLNRTAQVEQSAVKSCSSSTSAFSPSIAAEYAEAARFSNTFWMTLGSRRPLPLAAKRQTNLVARIEAATAANVLLMNHFDVVPVDRNAGMDPAAVILDRTSGAAAPWI